MNDRPRSPRHYAEAAASLLHPSRVRQAEEIDGLVVHLLQAIANAATAIALGLTEPPKARVVKL